MNCYFFLFVTLIFIINSFGNSLPSPQSGISRLPIIKPANQSDSFSIKNGIPANIKIESVQTSQIISSVPQNFQMNAHQFIYVTLTTIFTTCLIVADIIGVKLFEFKLPFPIFGVDSIEHTCGMLTFPVTFLFGDIINEYYGPKAATDTVYLGLAMSIFVFIIFNIAQALPYLDRPYNVTPAAFDMIFASAKLMYIASVLAYFVGQMFDIWLFGIIKRLTKGRWLWLRASGSTIISQLLDSFVVSYVAFSFGKSITNQTPATMDEILKIAITGYGLKFVLASLLTPFLYLIRYILHEKYHFQPLPVEEDHFN